MRWTPPYTATPFHGHLVITATFLVRQAKRPDISYMKPTLIQPPRYNMARFYVPMVAVVTGFHCTSFYIPHKFRAKVANAESFLVIYIVQFVIQEFKN